MDIKQCMIVDLEKTDDKRKFITERVRSIRKNAKGQWVVQFVSSSRIFNYNPSRLLFLTQPQVVDIDKKGLYINNRHITGINELICFTDGRHTYYHVTYNSGYYENLEARNVYITRTSIDDIGGSTWEYLNKLAAETGLLSEENDNILTRQYELVDVHRDNVPLAQFLGDKTSLRSYRTPYRILFPFGCNASQKSAVERALTHEVSIIQGPPGTGKTQTILNIIANLLMEHKTVLVVSNNNSAVENVAEKLIAEGLGFLVAQLGSVENKTAFINKQSGYPYLSEWILTNLFEVEHLAEASLKNVSKGFEAQQHQAELKAELDALQKEERYNELRSDGVESSEWLDKKSSSQIMQLLHIYQRQLEDNYKVKFSFKIKCLFNFGIKIYSFLRQKPVQVIKQLENAYYRTRTVEVEKEIGNAVVFLEKMDMEENLSNLRKTSLQLLKQAIARRYVGSERRLFNMGDLKSQTAAFLKEYPIVLSTTYSAKSCISKDMVFDYVIMDEASQVDIKTGALALSCANNAVIVGDDKQLPNVVSQEESMALNAIQSNYDIEEPYNAVTHSFLQSCIEVFKEAPSTLLREHYRCHPKIINFCNQRFYDNELLMMTNDTNEDKVLQVVRTVAGNHARGHFNQREIDVIAQEVIPEYKGLGSIGIITPYRLQAKAINKALGQDIASTVHKYQGRECDTIIMSMVDNQPTSFSDDPNLLNVAISRAKQHLCVVANGNEMDPNSILSQLISYIHYNNFEVKESRLHSVFDLLYQQYTTERLAYEAKNPQPLDFLSENLIYSLLTKAINKMSWTNISLLAHYQLVQLVGDWTLLDDKEKTFAESPFSHVDFLLYNTLTKQPCMAIEVDGWQFHKESETQQSRDVIKKQILEKIGLPLRRISTTETVNEEYIVKLLENIN